MSSFMREMQYKSIAEAMAVVEKMIVAARDREVRNMLVVRLAGFDQRLAVVRDRWGLPDRSVLLPD